MMCANQSDTDIFLDRARAGDASALNSLLGRHRTRLKRMVATRLDGRLKSRIDPSDVVQDAMVDAARRIDDYLASGDRLFYVWLRQIAWDRLVDLFRAHITAGKRSVLRELSLEGCVSDESFVQLADQLASDSLGPSARAMQEEVQARVYAAMNLLSAKDREILVLRHLEQLNVREIAETLSISTTAVTTRHLRALQRLRKLIVDQRGDS